MSPSLGGRTIVFCSNTLWYSYNFLSSLITACVSAGARVIVIGQRDEYLARLEALGCVCSCLPTHGRRVSPIHDLLLLARLYRRYRRMAPDAVLQFTAKPIIYGTLAAHVLRIPVINTVSGMGSPFSRGPFLRAALVALYRIAGPLARRTVFLNNHDRLYFTRRRMAGPRGVVQISSSGIDAEHFRPLPKTRTGPGFVFLFHSRLLWEKGVGVFLEASSIVRREVGERAAFWLLGRPALDRKDGLTLEMIREPGHLGPVEYLGFSSDVRRELREADCVVLPSTYGEGVPRSLLEAACMGIPIIGSDNVGSSEVVRHGENGLVLRHTDAPSLAAAMTQMMGLGEGARRRMGERGRALAMARFADAQVTGDYLSMIQPLMG